MNFQYLLCSFRKYSSYLYFKSVAMYFIKPVFILIYENIEQYILTHWVIILLLDNENLYQ